MRTQSLKHQHLDIHQGVPPENPPAMKAHQTDLDSHQQRDRKHHHHHQPKKLLHHQEDPAQNKEADPNNDDIDPHHRAPDHHPDN